MVDENLVDPTRQLGSGRERVCARPEDGDVRDGWVNYTIWAEDMVSALTAHRGVKTDAKTTAQQNAA